MVKRMNRYDELVNWLQEEHNEVFHQWAQIEAELDRKLEEANLIKISEDKKYHILTKDFGSYQQNIEINSFNQ